MFTNLAIVWGPTLYVSHNQVGSVSKSGNRPLGTWERPPQTHRRPQRVCIAEKKTLACHKPNRGWYPIISPNWRLFILVYHVYHWIYHITTVFLHFSLTCFTSVSEPRFFNEHGAWIPGKWPDPTVRPWKPGRRQGAPAMNIEFKDSLKDSKPSKCFSN